MLTNRPIIVSEESVIRVEVKFQDEDVVLTADGQVGMPLQGRDVVEVRKSKSRTMLIKSPTKDYFQVLRTKAARGGSDDPSLPLIVRHGFAMLADLIIKNFVLIDRLQVSFGPGFNVLTGETGAGKSIIIDAVGLLLGDRARPDLIRNGEKEAVIEAIFDLKNHPRVRREMEECGLEREDELLVRRVIARGGKNRIFLNGSLATLSQLQRLTSRLLSIYGQHEHQSLQRNETHLALLDRFGAPAKGL